MEPVQLVLEPIHPDFERVDTPTDRSHIRLGSRFVSRHVAHQRPRIVDTDHFAQPRIQLGAGGSFGHIDSFPTVQADTGQFTATTRPASRPPCLDSHSNYPCRSPTPRFAN